MKKFLLASLLGALVLGLWTVPSQAGELDALLDKLVNKGVLTAGEAAAVKEEAVHEASNQQMANNGGFNLPDWVQKMKLKGDFRLRYEYDHKHMTADARERGRIRLRFGVETKVADQVKVAFGLATGGSDSRSTNQTLQDFFSTPDIRLDYAYAEYKPTSDISVVGGKFSRGAYLWAPTDLLWDGDIRPDGMAFHVGHSLADDLKGWVNGGVWILDENGTADMPDPFLPYVQGGLAYKHDKVDAKVATTYYAFQGVKGLSSLDNSASTNTGAATGLQSTYRSIGASAEVGFHDIFGGLPLHADERIAFFGDYIHNLDNTMIKSGLNGWAFGFKFGNKKVSDPGTWQFKYIKAVLGKDAFLDTFPDSDRYGGGTDIYSNECILEYALKKNIILGLDYYNSRGWSSTNTNRKKTDHLLQADLVLKF